jgi:hypothetical protein
VPCFSKEDIRRTILEKAERDKEPLIIESISDAEKMTLHGDKCWSAMAYVKDGHGLSAPIFFVTKQGCENYISGDHYLITEVDDKGYDTVVAELRTANSDKLSPTPTPENAPTPENVGGVIGARREMMDGHEVTVLPTPRPDE